MSKAQEGQTGEGSHDLNIANRILIVLLAILTLFGAAIALTSPHLVDEDPVKAGYSRFAR